MALSPQNLPNDLAALKRIAAYHIAESNWLREQLALLMQQKYGRSSERFIGGNSGQLSLFEVNEEEEETQEEQDEEGDDEKTSRRTVRKRGRRRLPDYLPRKQIVIDVSDEEKICHCGLHKAQIGEEVMEQLDYQPAVLQVLQFIRPKFACRTCDGTEAPESPVVSIAPAVAQIIPRSIAGPSLLAHVFTSKFADSLPFYRQEGQLARLGVEIGRSTMCHWAQKATEACKPVLDLLYREVRSGPHIHADETPILVTTAAGKGPNQTSYMWVFLGGQPGKPAVAFIFDPSRGAVVVQDFLDDYQGGVQADAHNAYTYLEKMDGVVLFGCLAHARRKFTDVLKAIKDVRAVDTPGSPTKTLTEDIVERFRAIFAVDAAARERNLSPEETVELRQQKALPRLNDLKVLLDKRVGEVPPKSLLGKAIKYTISEWPRLIRYVDHGYARADNNLAENAIRPFVVGRKNWLFAGTPDGAKATAAMYSLVETAKANDLDPYLYLRYLFERVPLATCENDYRLLLPQYVDRTLPRSALYDP